MNDNQQALAKVMAEGQAEAQREQMKFHERQQETEVHDLRCQINDRLDRLTHLTDEVRRAVNEDREQFRYAHGAFGNDTDTLDTLLAALGQELGNLTEQRARMDMAERVSEGMAKQVIDMFEAKGGDGDVAAVVPMPTGQYL